MHDEMPVKWRSRIRWRPIALGAAALLVALYVGGFWGYYCFTESCTHPMDWFFHLEPAAIAAWAAATASMMVVIVTNRAVRAALEAPEIDARLRREETDALRKRRSIVLRFRIWRSCFEVHSKIESYRNLAAQVREAAKPSEFRFVVDQLNLPDMRALTFALEQPEIFSQLELDHILALSQAIDWYKFRLRPIMSMAADSPDDAIQEVLSAPGPGQPDARAGIADRLLKAINEIAPALESVAIKDALGVNPLFVG